MKIKFGIIPLGVVLLSLSLVQCKSIFYTLPNDIADSKSISGIYENESVLSPFGNKDLWRCIMRRSNIKNDSHIVYLHFEKKSLHAQLRKGDTIIARKKIKGTLTDSCFLARKKYFIVPILPLLWFYNNQQVRISARDGCLLIDEHVENGGAFFIMAGGDYENKTYEYKRINK